MGALPAGGLFGFYCGLAAVVSVRPPSGRAGRPGLDPLVRSPHVVLRAIAAVDLARFVVKH